MCITILKTNISKACPELTSLIACALLDGVCTRSAWQWSVGLPQCYMALGVVSAGTHCLSSTELQSREFRHSGAHKLVNRLILQSGCHFLLYILFCFCHPQHLHFVFVLLLSSAKTPLCFCFASIIPRKPLHFVLLLLSSAKSQLLFLFCFCHPQSLCTLFWFYFCCPQNLSSLNFIQIPHYTHLFTGKIFYPSTGDFYFKTWDDS